MSAPIPNYSGIDLNAPNPFTVRPIKTVEKTNDLILKDPEMRTRAFVVFADVGEKERCIDQCNKERHRDCKLRQRGSHLTCT